MFKKGQVTVFIVLGILIVALVSIGYFFTRKDSSAETAKVLTASTIVPAVEEKLEACFTKASADALLQVGKQGGFLEANEDSIAIEGEAIPFYGLAKNVQVPETSVFAASLEKALEDKMGPCITKEDFAPFTLSLGTPKATVILADETELQISYPVTIQSEEGSFSPRKEYQARYQVNIPKYLEMSAKIIQDATKDPLLVDHEAILAENFNLDVVPTEDLNIYLLSDDASVNQEKFELRFAYAY